MTDIRAAADVCKADGSDSRHLKCSKLLNLARFHAFTQVHSITVQPVERIPSKLLNVSDVIYDPLLRNEAVLRKREAVKCDKNLS